MHEAGANEDLVVELRHGRVWHTRGEAILGSASTAFGLAFATVPAASGAVCPSRAANIATVGFRHISTDGTNDANIAAECL